MYYIILGFLVGIGLFDLWLIVHKKKTISQRYHGLFNKWFDAAIMIGLMACIWWLGGGVENFTKVLIGLIIGHLCWYED
jgi:peptidoglycan biosynthesis protein MviN/MurJ (putative lipid II flippase)